MKRLIIALLFPLAIVGLVTSAASATGDRITICHATGSDSNPFVTLVLPPNAVYGTNAASAHFNEQGTPLSGHEDDYFGPCEQPTTTEQETTTSTTSTTTSTTSSIPATSTSTVAPTTTVGTDDSTTTSSAVPTTPPPVFTTAPTTTSTTLDPTTTTTTTTVDPSTTTLVDPTTTKPPPPSSTVVTTAPPNNTLPVTGVRTDMIVGFALALSGLGGLALFAVRRPKLS